MMNKKPKIVIIDYGVGNLRSLVRAFEHFGTDVSISEESSDLISADGLVLPGDGSFLSGIDGLMVRGLTGSIKKFAKIGKPILGICLGAQILLSEGYEFGKHPGLDLIKGQVVKFSNLKEKTKIPHIGWNRIKISNLQKWENTILDSIKNDSFVYFIHSYVLMPKNRESILAYSEYGGQDFCSVILRNNIYGCQFHPEKSGAVGLKIIENFIKIVSGKAQ